MRNDRLNEYSDLYIQETFALQHAINDVLLSYDRALAHPRPPTTYDVYAWYLDNLIHGQDFLYNDYPVNFMYVLGVIHHPGPVHRLPAADQPGRCPGLHRPAALPWSSPSSTSSSSRSTCASKPASCTRFVWEWSLGDVQGIASTPANGTAFYLTFRDKVNALEGLSDEQKETLRAQALQAVENYCTPRLCCPRRGHANYNERCSK